MPPVEEEGPQLHGGKVERRRWDVKAREEGEVGQEEEKEGANSLSWICFTVCCVA